MSLKFKIKVKVKMKVKVNLPHYRAIQTRRAAGV